MRLPFPLLGTLLPPILGKRKKTMKKKKKEEEEFKLFDNSRRRHGDGAHNYFTIRLVSSSSSSKFTHAPSKETLSWTTVGFLSLFLFVFMSFSFSFGLSSAWELRLLSKTTKSNRPASGGVFHPPRKETGDGEGSRDQMKIPETYNTQNY